MKCIYCGCEESRVVDSRSTEDGTSIRRRRECEQCGRRFTTYERIDLVPLMVIKKDQTRDQKVVMISVQVSGREARSDEREEQCEGGYEGAALGIPGAVPTDAPKSQFSYRHG